MQVVGAFACSHSGLIITRKDVAPPEQKERLFSAFSRMGEEILALEPDALVVIGTDHGRIFKLDHVPQYTIGVSATAKSIGDAGLPIEEVKIHQPMAQAILSGMIAAGVDIAYSEAMPIDHSFISPLTLAFGSRRVPIVPIIQNCNLPPFPSLRRSYEVGRALGDAIRSGPAGRVVILGTGGLSHWVGSTAYQNFQRAPAGTRLAVQDRYALELTDTGYVNENFDRQFLDLLATRRAKDFIAGWDTERIFREAGNGGQEIRNWLVVAGAVDDAPINVIAYGAVERWLTGTAIARFNLDNGRLAA